MSPIGSKIPDQKCSSDRVAEKTVMPITYSMTSATPCRYTMKIFRVSAQIAKKMDPKKNTWTTMIERNGCRYHHKWLGPIRAWSAHGAKVPMNVPAIIPEKVNTVVTNDPAQRPPR